MSKRLTIFAALLTLSTLASAVTMPLPRLKYGDASLQVHNVQAMTGTPTVYLGDTNISAFTVCGWYKAEPTETVKMYGSVLAHAMVSVVSARATKEGGDKLDNVLPFDQSTAVPLDSSGEWSAACLPATTDPTGGGGCFVVNIQCDKSVNLTIGDQSLTFAASDEMQIRNVWTSDNNNGRTIAVSTDAGATVYLGVAVNPVVRFYSVQNDSFMEDGDDAQTNGGVVTNEYRFLVFRGKLDGANLTFTSEAWNRAGKLVCARTNVTAVTAKTFAKNARFSLDFGVACEGAWAKLNVHKFGLRAYSEWIDDDLLLSMRDKDWTEMTSRGLTYDGERGEAWTLTADVTTIASATGTTASHTDAATTLAYTTTPETRDVKRTVTLHAKSCLLDGFVVSDDEMDWSCETSGATYEQASNVFTFAAAGQYTLRGYNRKLAAAKTISINLTDGQSYVKYVLGNPSSASSPYGVACASLVEALAAVNLSPLAYTVNGSVKTAAVTVCKSVTSVPIRSTAGKWGNAAVSCLSPHTWISAAHWWGVQPSTLTYTDGVTTSTVKTASGTFVFLRDWAAAKGYSDAVVKACSDIAVGRFAEGAVDASLCPYLMTAQTMTNAFGAAFAVPAWRSTQTSLGTCLPVLLRGGSDGAYVDGQASEAEDWSNVGSYLATSAASYARDLVAKSVVEAVANLAAKKTDKTMRLFAECYGGDSGHPTYVEPERGKFVLVTQNHTIYGGDSDAAVYDVLKVYVESEGDTIKTWSY